MGLIVSFPSNGQKPSRRRLVQNNGEAADILFFTGVRYSRHETSMAVNGGELPASGPKRSQSKNRRRKVSRR